MSTLDDYRAAHFLDWDFDAIIRTYIARCSCGWESRSCGTLAVARALHGEHLAYLTDGSRVVRP